MSGILLLNSDKKIAKSKLKQRIPMHLEGGWEKEFMQLKDISILYFSLENCGLSGYGYFFDNMWIPLTADIDKAMYPKAYANARAFYEWFRQLISDLLDESYELNLLFINCENETQKLSSEIKTIHLNKISIGTILDFRTLYRVVR